MRYRLQYTHAAMLDLENLFSYIAFDLSSPESAEKIYNLIQAEIESLCDFPFRCAEVTYAPWKAFGLRQMTVKSFRIFYIPNNQNTSLTIIRILHVLQNVDSQLMAIFK